MARSKTCVWLICPRKSPRTGRDSGRNRRRRAGRELPAASRAQGDGRLAAANSGEQVISRMELDPRPRFDVLSAGLKRRVLLARGLVRQPGPAAAGRAHQPPGYPIHRLAGRFPEALGRHAAVRHPRPGIPAETGHPHRRAGPRPPVRLGLRLRHFPQRKEAMLAAEQDQNVLFDKKLAQEEAVDPARDRSPAHAQRRPGARAAAPARAAPRAARTARQNPHADPGRAALRADW